VREESDRIDELTALTRRAQWILQELAPAEDAVGEALLRQAEGDPASLETLVHMEALNLRRDTLRRYDREAPMGLGDALASLLHPPGAPYRPSQTGQLHLTAPRALTIEGAEFHADFDRAVRALPELERDAFILTELRGLDQREAAAVLGIHQSTVSRRHQAAVDAIREEIA
jgi:RNA polymerase sigma factor (sigma-70 family)